MKSIKLSVIVPCHNVSPYIQHTVHSFRDELEKLGLTFEVILVSDGSVDGTDQKIKEIKEAKRLIYGPQKGKGYALKRGFSISRGEIVTFIDADIELPPGEIGSYVTSIVNGEADIVIGSKEIKGASVQRPWWRKLASSILLCAVRHIFHLPFTDTQGGLKCFRRETLKTLIADSKCNGFALDIELLVINHLFVDGKVIEKPLVLTDYHYSTFSISALVQMLGEIVLLSRQYGRLSRHSHPLP